MRDYDVIIERPALRPDGQGTWIEGKYRFRFTHCVLAEIMTNVQDDSWKCSWEDIFIDYENWEAAGQPDGYVWGTCWSLAYPGATYIPDSSLAKEWSRRLQKPMHEMVLETNAYTLRLVFHNVTLTKIAQADPESGELEDLTR